MGLPEYLRNIDWQLISHYIVAIMVLPIVVVTVKNVVKNSATLFDSDLTATDRSLLKQFALFLLLPLVALFHEMGHALVAPFLGVNVVALPLEFHFFGQVDVSGGSHPTSKTSLLLSPAMPFNWLRPFLLSLSPL